MSLTSSRRKLPLGLDVLTLMLRSLPSKGRGKDPYAGWVRFFTRQEAASASVVNVNVLRRWVTTVSDLWSRFYRPL